MSSLLKEDRDNLTRIAVGWARQLNKDKFHEIATSLSNCFEAWKLSKADAHGMVESYLPTFDLSGKPRKVPVTGAPAWVCMPSCHDFVSLGFNLWLEGEGTFRHLILRYGLGEVFAILVLVGAENASLSSLARANGLLAGLLEVDNALLREDAERRSKGLKSGPSAAAARRREKSRNNNAMLAERFGHLFRRERPMGIKAAATLIEREINNPSDPLHGAYTFLTLRDKVLPELKNEVRAQEYQRQRIASAQEKKE